MNAKAKKSGIVAVSWLFVLLVLALVIQVQDYNKNFDKWWLWSLVICSTLLSLGFILYLITIFVGIIRGAYRISEKEANQSVNSSP